MSSTTPGEGAPLQDPTRAMSTAHEPGNTTRMEPHAWEPPTVARMQAMLPQYQFVARIGRGGMGAVYTAIQLSLDRQVAVKILAPGVRDDGGAKLAERFKLEARTLARMSHPCIVHVHDSGQTPDGQLFFVMEYIDGTDVQRLLQENGPLAPEQALAITAHVCDALEYAHGLGVIHRDIKPANVLISRDGSVKIADFGLAKALGDQSDELTRANMVMGTPHYMAPEAMRAGGEVDGRADLYAVGVMLYTMLTGQVPTGRFEPPSLKTGCDRRFDGIVDKAMQSDRERRFQSATELRHALDTILTAPVPKAEAIPAEGSFGPPVPTPAPPLAAGVGNTEQTAIDSSQPRLPRNPGGTPAVRSREKRRWVLPALVGLALASGYFLLPRADKTGARPAEIQASASAGFPSAAGKPAQRGTEAPGQANPPVAPVKGASYRITNVNSHLALSLAAGGAKIEEAPIIQRQPGVDTRQQWEFVAVQGHYRIVNRRSRQVLNVHALEEETPVVASDGGDHALWSLEFKGDAFQIRSRSIDMVIDVADESIHRKASIVLYPSHGGPNQLFELEMVTE